MQEYSVIELDRWIDPEDAFVMVEALYDDLFWLDSGPTSGVAWLGTGTRAPQSDVAAARAAGEPAADLLAGGWVGWLAYEDGVRMLGMEAGEDAAEPTFVQVDAVARFDRDTRTVTVRGDATFVDALRSVSPAPAPAAAPDRGVAHARVTPSRHARLVEECRELIAAGEAYQLCLTTRFSVEGPVDAASVYRRLRGVAASHHGGFIRIGGTTLLTITPEVFLDVTGATVTTRPIKGTRRRADDEAEDRALAAELAVDEKERAENVMIVDLMRNDLSRVCVPGSVTVPSLWAVETYPTVHQLVSTVRGVLRDGVTVGDVWRAAFPAGSMTGAPKRSAMSHLSRLEDAPRGIYSGCFGWVGAAGGMDLAMVIRAVVVTDTGAYVGSGGGITWGSIPVNEVAEVGVKARIPLWALGARVPAGW